MRKLEEPCTFTHQTENGDVQLTIVGLEVKEDGSIEIGFIGGLEYEDAVKDFVLNALQEYVDSKE